MRFRDYLLMVVLLADVAHSNGLGAAEVDPFPPGTKVLVDLGGRSEGEIVERARSGWYKVRVTRRPGRTVIMTLPSRKLQAVGPNASAAPPAASRVQDSRANGASPAAGRNRDTADAAQPAGESLESEYQELLALEKQVRALHSSGRLGDATSLAQQMAERAERALARRPQLVAYFVHDLAFLYDLQGQYQKAEPLFRRVVQLQEQALGSEHPSVATALNYLAEVYRHEAKYAEAEPLYQRALRIHEKGPNPESADAAKIINDMGNLFYDQAKYSDAAAHFERALHIYEKVKGPEDRQVATALNNLAEVYRKQARLAEAETLNRRALQIRERILPPEHADIAMSLNNLAMLCADQGKYAEAEPLCQRALRIHEKLYGPEHPSVAVSLNNLARLYMEQGEFGQAEPLYRRSLDISEKRLGPNHPRIGLALNNLALLYVEQQKLADAERLYQRALEIYEKAYGPQHPAVAQALVNLAGVYRRLGSGGMAEPLYERALRIKEAHYGPDHPSVATALNDLALLYHRQGKYTEAEPLEQRAVRIYEKAYGPKHPDVATVLTNLARLYRAQRKYAEADAMVSRAIEIRDAARVSPGDRFNSYELRAYVRWRLGRQGEAIADLSRALDLAEEARERSFGDELSRADFFANFAGAYEQMVAWQAELKQPARVLATIERSLARSLIDQMAAAKLDLLDGLPPAEADGLRVREAKAKRRLAELQQQAGKLADAAQPGDVTALMQQLSAAQEEVVQSYIAIRNASPALRQLLGKSFDAAKLDEVQSTLIRGDGLLLEYLLGDRSGCVVVVPPAGEPARMASLVIGKSEAVVLGVTAGPLTAQRMRQILDGVIHAGLLEELQHPLLTQATVDKLAVLWRVLIPQPERARLTSGQLKHWIVVPNAELAALPFEALVVEAGGDPRYALDAAPPIVYGPSATALCNLSQARPSAVTPAAEPVLTVGAPLVSESAGLITTIINTGTESRWIKSAFSECGFGTRQLIGTEATEANFCSACPGRRIIHLDCHGLSDRRHGNFFGFLWLVPGEQSSSPADPSNDGMLTLREIYALDLRGCELAILSACQTNAGAQQRGEGTLGLSRGFLVAGSRRVVATNWVVYSTVAADLVRSFCTEIAKGEEAGHVDYSASLQTAKRAVRKQAESQSPCFWAPFVLLGPN